MLALVTPDVKEKSRSPCRAGLGHGDLLVRAIGEVLERRRADPVLRRRLITLVGWTMTLGPVWLTNLPMRLMPR
jgi:hypothetical protein